ncbi:MAG: M50 family metallopeptidase [Bacteroidota bacterium]
MAKNKKFKLTKLQKQQIEFSIITFITLFSFFFWDSYIIYPIKIFVVLSHEISHGLATIFTGGKLQSILLTSTLGGATYSVGGNKFIISSAGYLGSLGFGAALFASGYNITLRKVLGVFLSVILILFAANFISGSLGRIISVVFALFFILLPFYTDEIVNTYFFKIFGLISMFYVIIDIKEDLFADIYRPSDAQFISEITNIPVLFWSIFWLVLSVIIIALLIRWGVKKGI